MSDGHRGSDSGDPSRLNRLSDAGAEPLRWGCSCDLGGDAGGVDGQRSAQCMTEATALWIRCL